MSDSTSGLDLFNRLADEFADRFRQGERPALSEYTERYPELANQIRELFPALMVIEQLGTGGDGSAVPLGEQLHAATPLSTRLGDYRILREIARGGMGVVYEAAQESLGRHVAIKVLPRWMSDPHQLERFRREARAAAMLHHSNIVPVFGVGEHEGVHYYAMQYIHGQSLDTVLKEVKRLRGVTDAEAGCQRSGRSDVRGLCSWRQKPAGNPDAGGFSPVDLGRVLCDNFSRNGPTFARLSLVNPESIRLTLLPQRGPDWRSGGRSPGLRP
jgi:hypothetical protein